MPLHKVYITTSMERHMYSSVIYVCRNWRRKYNQSVSNSQKYLSDVTLLLMHLFPPFIHPILSSTHDSLLSLLFPLELTPPLSLLSLHILSNSLKMAQRVTYRRRLSYNTKSNKIRVVKTPGGKLNVQYVKKRTAAPKCGDCGVPLPGIPVLRPTEYAVISKTKKNVTRAYGGSRCSTCVRSR